MSFNPDAQDNEWLSSDVTSQSVTKGVRDADGNYEEVSSVSTSGNTVDVRSEMMLTDNHFSAVSS